MCLALYKPATATLDPTAMQHAHRANPDGCGFAVRLPGGVGLAKGLWTFAEFWRQFAPYQHCDAAVHFRWASQGAVTTENCHPFALQNGSALIHNGHLAGYGTQAVSDTAAWVTSVLNPLLAAYPDALTQAAILRLLTDSLDGSKVVILGPTATTILGEAGGHWQGGVWYSNTSYLPPRPPRVPRAALRDDWRADVWGAEDSDEGGDALETTRVASFGLDAAEDETGEPCECCWEREASYAVCGRCMDAIH